MRSLNSASAIAADLLQRVDALHAPDGLRSVAHLAVVSVRSRIATDLLLDSGITLLALSDIFHAFAIRHYATRKYVYALLIFYIEIHNEVINDLLDEVHANMRIVDTKDQGPVVKDCTEQLVGTLQDVI